MKNILSLVILYATCALAYRGDQFATNLFKSIIADKSNENVVFSPVAVEASVAMMLYGAGGRTEKEIRKSIDFETESKDEVVKGFGDFVAKNFKETRNKPQLTWANRLYVNEGVHIKPQFSQMVERFFSFGLETVDFSESEQTTANINSWVEEQTQGRITDLLSPTSVDADTTALLVNAVYFQACWEVPFLQASTKKDDFLVSASERVAVDFMSNTDTFKYGELPELDAKAVLLPYKNSDLSLIIVLPNKVDGLQRLEERLSFKDLKTQARKMAPYKVDVLLPKFEIEFDTELKKPFAQMGMKMFFTKSADFRGIFTSPSQISLGVHKVFFNVDEQGMEFASGSYVKVQPASRTTDSLHKEFRADHPFVFAILNGETIYFAGHVTNF